MLDPGLSLPPRPVTGSPALFDVHPYTPSFALEIPAGETAVEEIQGRTGGAYGIMQLLPGGPGMADVDCTLIINAERTLLRGVRLSALHALYKRHRLYSPLIVAEGSVLELRLTNTSAAATTVTFAAPGLPADALDVYMARRREEGIPPLVPRYVYASGEIGASAQSEFEVETGARDAVLHRLALDAEAEDETLVSLYRHNERLFRALTKRQVNERYDLGAQTIPYRIGAQTPMRIALENLTAAATHMSFVAEVYQRP